MLTKIAFLSQTKYFEFVLEKGIRLIEVDNEERGDRERKRDKKPRKATTKKQGYRGQQKYNT